MTKITWACKSEPYWRRLLFSVAAKLKNHIIFKCINKDAWDQSALKHGRSTFQNSAMGELACSGQLWARAALKAASRLQGWIARAFSSNSFVNTMDMTAAIEHILTATQSLGSQDYYRKSRMMILGLAGVLFCENEQA